MKFTGIVHSVLTGFPFKDAGIQLGIVLTTLIASSINKMSTSVIGLIFFIEPSISTIN